MVFSSEMKTCNISFVQFSRQNVMTNWVSFSFLISVHISIFIKNANTYISTMLTRRSIPLNIQLDLGTSLPKCTDLRFEENENLYTDEEIRTDRIIQSFYLWQQKQYFMLTCTQICFRDIYTYIHICKYIGLQISVGMMKYMEGRVEADPPIIPWCIGILDIPSHHLA